MAWSLVGTVLLAIAALGAFVWWSRRTPLPRATPIVLEVPERPDLRALSRELAARGLVTEPWLFELYLRLPRARGEIEPGLHLLTPGVPPVVLAACLTRSVRPTVKVTIPEGYTQFQIARRFEESGVAVASAFIEASRSPRVLSELDVPGSSAEGYLFPATYDFYLDSRPEALVRILVQQAQSRYRALAERHAAGVERLRERLGWGTHEVITLASIVERESGVQAERGLIAGVFFNRLRDPTFRPLRMLQSDTTAGYGCLLPEVNAPSCRGFKGTITPDLLRDAENPYNTYKHAGLPPGPIANPGEGAIGAVLDAPETPYFFFVAAKDGQRHVFSRTWAEHRAAIEALTLDRAPTPSVGATR